MELNRKIIVNGYYKGASWYEQGQKRLCDSAVNTECFEKTNIGLIAHEIIDGDIYMSKNDYFDSSCPYTVKAAILKQTINDGFDKILWVDCSVWLHQNPQPIFDIIEKEGYFIMDSGYNCAQTISDNALQLANITRDEAELIPEAWSCIFGVNLNHPKGLKIAEDFLHLCEIGVFKGSREHDNQSKDPRFKFHRQDQSALSIAAHWSNAKLTPNTKYMAYVGQDHVITEDTIFKMQGL